MSHSIEFRPILEPAVHGYAARHPSGQCVEVIRRGDAWAVHTNRGPFTACATPLDNSNYLSAMRTARRIYRAIK